MSPRSFILSVLLLSAAFHVSTIKAHEPVPTFDALVPTVAEVAGSETQTGEIPVLESNESTLLLTQQAHPGSHRWEKRLGKGWSGHRSTLIGAGTSGVGAMQIAVVDDDNVVIFDKAENNPLKVNGHPAWGAVYKISTKKVRPLNLQTNSFCAGGGFLSNGTLVSVGGNPVQGSYWQAANGLTALRMFTPCDDDKCDVYESPSRIRLTSKRWYATTVRLEDGSLSIWGGMIAGGFNNAPATDNPTLEYFPPKGNGLPVYSQFLHDALNTNLFPLVWQLPDGQLFVAANEMAMLYNWKTNTETRLPGFPNGVKINYPDTPAAVLLPLTKANNWTPEVLICGGSTANSDGDPWLIDSSYAASKQCVRMVLNAAGIKGGWQVELMPEARVMGDAILMPDGTVLLINGAASGIAGYGNVKNQVGASNAKNPTLRPTLYDPLAAKGKRFSTDFPASKIERLYHSSATLIPDGRVLISGSNPNDDVTTRTYASRYEVELLRPPYLYLPRPSYTKLPKNLVYGKSYLINIVLPAGTKEVTAVVMDLGYSTHSVHMNNRHVELRTTRPSTTQLRIYAPQTKGIYPPGWGFVYILADGVPSQGHRLMVGDGSGPPVSQAAIDNMLKYTKGV